LKLPRKSMKPPSNYVFCPIKPAVGGGGGGGFHVGILRPCQSKCCKFFGNCYGPFSGYWTRVRVSSLWFLLKLDVE
jgi:hypothetical protein